MRRLFFFALSLTAVSALAVAPAPVWRVEDATCVEATGGAHKIYWFHPPIAFDPNDPDQVAAVLGLLDPRTFDVRGAVFYPRWLNGSEFAQELDRWLRRVLEDRYSFPAVVIPLRKESGPFEGLFGPPPGL